MTPITVLTYETEDGVVPIDEWLRRLRDKPTAHRIGRRLKQLTTGNLGDCKFVGGGVWELRFDFGPGFRVYFARHGSELILLLAGGDKSTQQKDIKLAQRYWLRWQDSERSP